MADCGHTLCEPCIKPILKGPTGCPLCSATIYGEPVRNWAVEEVSAAITGRAVLPHDEWDTEGVEEAFRAGFEPEEGEIEG